MEFNRNDIITCLANEDESISDTFSKLIPYSRDVDGHIHGYIRNLAYFHISLYLATEKETGEQGVA